MVKYCSVPCCSSTLEKNSGISFHSFPKEKDLKKAWCTNLKISKPVTPNMIVCSKHFNSDDFIQLEGYQYIRARLKKTSVPSLNLPKTWPKKPLQKSASKNVNVPKQLRRPQEISQHENIFVPHCEILEQGEPECPSMSGLQKCTSSQESKECAGETFMQISTTKDETIAILQMSLESKDAECLRLEKEMSEMKTCITTKDQQLQLATGNKRTLEAQVNSGAKTSQRLQHNLKLRSKRIFSIESIKHDNALLNYYTGLPSYDMFCSLLNYVVPDGDTSCIDYAELSPIYLELEEQLFFVLAKMRQNYGFQDFAFRFGKSASGLSKLFEIWINYLHLRLGSLSIWPHRSILIANSPADFLSEFPNVMGVIDCTELYLEKSSDLCLQSQTVKGLIGIGQCGGIIFISHLMGGSISDQEMITESGLLAIIKSKIDAGELLPSDEVMADEGFCCHEVIKNAGINLLTPLAPDQMSDEDVKCTNHLAKFRVHVERTMKRIKKFKILSGIVPATILESINQIWTVACILANLQLPLK